MMMEVSSPPEYASTTFSRIGAPRRKAVSPALQQQNKNRFLDVQAVLRLIENNRTRRVNDGTRDFIAAMRRQAMHKQGMFGSKGKQFLVHLERREDFTAIGGFVLLPHAGPHVGINRVGAANGFDWIVEDPDLCARGGRQFAGGVGNLDVRFIAFRRADRDRSS